MLCFGFVWDVLFWFWFGESFCCCILCFLWRGEGEGLLKHPTVVCEMFHVGRCRLDNKANKFFMEWGNPFY